MSVSLHRPPKIQLLFATIIVFILGLSYLAYRVVPELIDTKLRQHDLVQTNHEIADAYKFLTPALAPLQITVPKPGNATCQPGDPELYAHLCGAQASLQFQKGLKIPQDANVMSKLLQDLDTRLKTAGWERGGNDFRRGGDQPVSSWATSLRNYGVIIGYRKGSC